MIESLWKDCTDLFWTLKLILSNTFHRYEGWGRHEDVKIRIFPSSARKVLLKIDFKTVNTVLSQTFNHKIRFEYSIRSQLSAVSF